MKKKRQKEKKKKKREKKFLMQDSIRGTLEHESNALTTTPKSAGVLARFSFPQIIDRLLVKRCKIEDPPGTTPSWSLCCPGPTCTPSWSLCRPGPADPGPSWFI